MAVVAKIRWRKFDYRAIAALGGWETVPLSTGDELPLIRVASWSKGVWRVEYRVTPDSNFADGWHWQEVIVPETGPGATPGYMTHLDAGTAKEARAMAEQHWDYIAEEARGLLAEGLAEIAKQERAKEERLATPDGAMDEIERQLTAAGIPMVPHAVSGPEIAAESARIAAPAPRPARLRPPPVQVDDGTFKSLLGEGLHTALRKASDHNEARAAWYAIDRLPAEEWNAVLSFVVSGIHASGCRLVSRDTSGGEEGLTE